MGEILELGMLLNYNFFIIKLNLFTIKFFYIDTGIIQLNVRNSDSIEILDEPAMELYDLILGGEALTRN